MCTRSLSLIFCEELNYWIKVNERDFPMGCKRDVDFSYLANTYLINPFNQRIHKSKDMN